MTAYLFDNKSYPIVMREKDIVPALRDPFTRAVTLRAPELAFDTSGVTAKSDPELALLYSKDMPNGRPLLRAGQKVYERDFNSHDIELDSSAAGIEMTSEAIEAFTKNCNIYREIFSRVILAYTGAEDTSLRSFVLFAPIGGKGRAQELHIDNTILSLHWSAALAGLAIANADPDEQLWKALNKNKRSNLKPEERKSNMNFLVQAAKNPAIDLRDNAIGDVIITKGRYGRNLLDADVRQSVCIHSSSEAIMKNGQAGLLIVPTLPKPL